VLSMNRIPVAQVFNLLYRRVALGKAVDNSGASDADRGLKIRDTAEYNSAPHANAGSWSQCAPKFWDWGLPRNSAAG